MTPDASPLEKTKEAVDELLRGIGLLDIIVGSLYLYLAFVWSKGGAGTAFPSTGFAWIDVILLASAAAIVGLLNGIPIAVILAVYRVLAKDAKSDLEKALERWVANPIAPVLPTDDKIDLAAEFCATRVAARYPSIESARLRARAAAGFVAVGIGYEAFAVSNHRGASVIWLVLFIIAMFFVGHMHYRDYLSGLRLALITGQP
jgi:hypothetical protein